MRYFKMQLFSVLFALLLILIGCGNASYTLKDSSSEFIVLDSSVGTDLALDEVIKPYRNSLNQEIKKVIGTAERELSGGLPEGLLTNFVTDLVLEECRAQNLTDQPDISIINVKGLRVPISQGEITVESIYQLMPFENEIVYLTLSKEKVIELFDFMASVDGDGISGAQFGIKNKRAVNIKVNNQALEDRNYIVATSDYLADGGDHFKVFQAAIKREGTGLKVRDVITQHIIKLTEAGQSVNSQLDKRIYYAK